MGGVNRRAHPQSAFIHPSIIRPSSVHHLSIIRSFLPSLANTCASTHPLFDDKSIHPSIHPRILDTGPWSWALVLGPGSSLPCGNGSDLLVSARCLPSELIKTEKRMRRKNKRGATGSDLCVCFWDECVFGIRVACLSLWGEKFCGRGCPTTPR